MNVVGILGGVGAGKSTVARMLVELCNETAANDDRPPRRAAVIDADRMAHEALETAPVRGALRAWLGGEVFDPTGRVDRAAVAKRVFGDAAELRRLEALVHPPVLAGIRRELARVRAAATAATDLAGGEDGAPAPDLLVLDVPLLTSTTLRDECDAFLYVAADLAVREERVARTRGWSAGTIAERERHQRPASEKRELATWVIDNSRGESETRGQLAACIADLRRRGESSGVTKADWTNEPGDLRKT